MAPIVALLSAIAGGLCILLSTVFGVSDLSDWLLYAAQGLFALAVVVFGVYVMSGIIKDAMAA